jgi:hypothetical protein
MAGQYAFGLEDAGDECTTDFPIGKHATHFPEILKRVAAAGHTIGLIPGRTPI